MKTLKQLLAEKNRLPVVVSPKDMVFHALQVMADNGVGAVLVMDGERLVGIFSERDYARKIALANKNSKETPVSEVMTSVPPRSDVASPSELTLTSMREPGLAKGGRLAVTMTAAIFFDRLSPPWVEMPRF